MVTLEELKKIKEENSSLKKQLKIDEEAIRLSKENILIKRKVNPSNFDKFSDGINSIAKFFVNAFNKLIPPLSKEEKEKLKTKKKSMNFLPERIDVLGFSKIESNIPKYKII